MKTDVCTEVEKSLRKEWEEMWEWEGRADLAEGVEGRQGERVKVF